MDSAVPMTVRPCAGRNRIPTGRIGRIPRRQRGKRRFTINLANLGSKSSACGTDRRLCREIRNRTTRTLLADYLEGDEETAPTDPKNPAGRGGFLRKRPVTLLLALIAVAALCAVGVHLWNYLQSYQWTDDAEIDGHLDPISTRVNGTVFTFTSRTLITLRTASRWSISTRATTRSRSKTPAPISARPDRA